MSNPAELSRWATLAKAHWKEFQPTRYAMLVEDGTLDEEANAAARLTYEALKDEMQTGLDQESAWERVRELYLFPPAEETEDEPMPENLAYQVIVENNAMMRQDEDQIPD